MFHLRFSLGKPTQNRNKLKMNKTKQNKKPMDGTVFGVLGKALRALIIPSVNEEKKERKKKSLKRKY